MKNLSPKQVSSAAAIKAGAELLRHFGKVSRALITTKSKHEIVTPADFAAEKIILSAIKKNFPTDRILSEEAGDNKKQSDYLWIIDPLDGTTNFAMGNPLFSISIALAKKEEIIMALVYIPFLKDLYLAEKNKGAFLNGQKIHVSVENKIANSFLTFCHGGSDVSVKKAINIYSKLKPVARDLRQIGTAALETAWVARGKTEAIIIPGVNPWDVAAGALLIREAGGIVTDLDGQPWTIHSKGIIASNKNIHQPLLNIIKNIP
ncbi:MAG TPA: inositol monophosphatase family protein [Patescibacteria group bacterium]|nr:inositol monophosphatase family protein [Patescibacteria group bacterium]